MTGESPAAVIFSRQMHIRFPEVMIHPPVITIPDRDAIQKSKMKDIAEYQLKLMASIH